MTDLEKVKEKGYKLRYVKNQTPEICLAAVKQDDGFLQFIEFNISLKELVIE